MGRNNIIPIILSVFILAITLDLIHAVPVAIHTNGRTLRSVTLHRQNSRDENPFTNLLLSQQKLANATPETVLAQRENITGIGDGANTPSTIITGDGSDVEAGGGGVGVNGTFSNDTRVGSRLKRNETEPCSLEPSILCSSDPTDRDKQRRILHIVNYLMTNLFGNRTRPVNKEIPRQPTVIPSTNSFSGGLQSIPASCDLPSEVESEAWSSERHFNLYFNLTSYYPDVFGSAQNPENSSSEQQQSLESGQTHDYLPTLGSQPLLSTITVIPRKTVNIVSAKLRLYKIGSTETNNNVPTSSDTKPSELCDDTETTSDSNEAVPSVLPTKVTFPEFSPSVDEKIRVSVFWYTQPATKNHYKKRLVDTKMLSLRESTWVEFDIRNAAKAWLNDREPNFGLVVEVENDKQDALDPRKYFRSAPCFTSSSETTYQKDDSKNELEQENSELPAAAAAGEINTSTTSPTIVICTLNVPEALSRTNFFPTSMNINSLHHLQVVAASHAKASNTTQNSTRYPWQNINLQFPPEGFGSNSSGSSELPRPTTTIIHRHRHHHELNPENNGGNNNNHNPTRHHTGSQNHQQSQQQQRNKSRFSHPGGFTLDEDHPLREILATVNGNSKESSKQRGGSSTIGTHRFPESLGKGLGSHHLISEMPADDGRVGGTDYFDDDNERDIFITKIVMTPAQLQKNALSGFFPFPTPSPQQSTDSGAVGSSER